MIIIIDNYDSFTYNLVDYFGKLSNLPIKVFRNDAIGVNEIAQYNPSYIVISPGPKAPKDAGISKAVIAAYGSRIPILGVCLGHQSIGEVFGCEIIRANLPMHGKTSMVIHRDDPLFAGIANPFQATRYHSLVINTLKLTQDIVPIAFSVDDAEIMAVKHRIYPIYGVQFHPESICTDAGVQIIENFLKMHAPMVQ